MNCRNCVIFTLPAYFYIKKARGKEISFFTFFIEVDELLNSNLNLNSFSFD